MWNAFPIEWTNQSEFHLIWWSVHVQCPFGTWKS